MSWSAAGVAVLLVAVFAIQVGTFESLKPARPDAPAVETPPDQVTVEKSTITGFDDDSQPFSVKATKATQDSTQPNLVHLETVSAALRRTSGETISLQATGAKFDRDTESLDLDGNVKLQSGDRFQADMDTARVTLRDKRFRSEAPVTVLLSNGTVTSNGMEITDDGDRILFFNGVKAKFPPAKQEIKQP